MSPPIHSTKPGTPGCGAAPPPSRPAAILMVCTGNICRSPMAEGILRDALRRARLDRIRVSSAGVWGWDAHPATPEAVAACREKGVDIGPHRSRPVSREMVSKADWILAMEETHVQALNQRYPEAASKIHLLGTFHPRRPGIEVADPYGHSPAVYRNCRQLIDRCIGGIIHCLNGNGSHDA